MVRLPIKRLNILRFVIIDDSSVFHQGYPMFYNFAEEVEVDGRVFNFRWQAVLSELAGWCGSGVLCW